MKIIFLIALLNSFQFCLEASPVASAGQDQNSAPFVPVILDGTQSTDSNVEALSYYWEQIAGEPLELIGQDRSKAMIIAADKTGVFDFELSVSNGTETARDVVTITISKPAGRIIYVDHEVAQRGIGNYSIAKRDRSGSDGDVYPSIQKAADLSKPGDTIRIRGGIYKNVFISNKVYLEIVHITRSGTAGAPIRFEAFEGEKVSLVGFGYEDKDLDGDKFADGPRHSKKRETLFLVGADYIQVVGLDLYNSQGEGLKVGGNFCYIEECRSRDNWDTNFVIRNESTEPLRGTVFRYLEGYRSRHSGGGLLDIKQSDAGMVTSNAVVDCLFYKNGYQEDGKKVLPIPGDPAGGGNSDGFAVSKNINEAAETNLGPGNFLVGNIVAQNADDGIDICFADSLVENNMVLRNGPEGNKGFKVFLAVSNLTLRGNLAYANREIGFELRTNGAMTVLQNSSIGNGGQGMWGDVTDLRNNLCTGNNRKDLATSIKGRRNWVEDGENAPRAFSGQPELCEADVTLLLESGTRRSVKEKWQLTTTQVAQAFSPRSGSPLIDRGEFIAGYHCPRADDDPDSPMPPHAPGRHWRGSAPDLGAFEAQ